MLVENGVISEAKSQIDSRAADWERLLSELIQIPSIFESEHRIIDYVCENIRATGCTPFLIPMDAESLHCNPDAKPPFSKVAGRNNVVVHIAGQGGGQSLILNSHLDIVPEGAAADWTFPPFSGHVDSTKKVIYGRGSMDDKAGVAICLGLIRIIRDLKLRFLGDVIFQFVLEDETTGNGSLACLAAGHVADAAIIIDGTRRDRAVNQQAGHAEILVRQSGRPASVSVSHLGMNAIEALSRTLLHLRETFFRLNEKRQAPWTEFPSPYQFIIQAMHADADRLMISIEATARCYLTFPPPDTLANIRSFIESKCKKFARNAEISPGAELEWSGFAIEPSASPSNDRFEAVVSRAVHSAGIDHFRVGASTGTSDMRHFVKRSIPCMLYGPGRGYNPHRADEYFHLEDLPFMMKLYLDIAASWCGTPTEG